MAFLVVAPTGPGLHYLHPTLSDVSPLLPCLLRPGVQISIVGKVPSRTRRFSFNLQKGTGRKTADIAFHFNPRFDEEPVVVRNARLEGSWGVEECAGPTEAEFPLPRKADFRVVIETHEECFKVLVNGQHFVDFAHRTMLENATHLCIKGEVKVYAVHIQVPLPDRLVATIPGNLKLGDIISLSGQIPSEGSRFYVNLQSGTEDNDDIVFHFNPRLDGGAVVRNTRAKEEWGSEETDGDLPFSAESPFQLAIAALHDRFQIFVNGHHFTNYSYRLPVEQCFILVVGGDIQLDKVVFESPAPKIVPPTGDRKIKPEDILAQEFNTVVPYTMPIPGALQPGRLVLISATPVAGASRFEVNLLAGPADDADIHFHLNPRFGEDSCVVRNSRLAGEWGSEEREGPAFPFEPNVAFHLVIAARDDNLVRVWVNGEHQFDYQLRGDPSAIDHVQVGGDVFVKRILVA